MKRKTGIDFFRGLGGFGLGMRKAGIECILGVDIWDSAVSVYEENFFKSGSGSRAGGAVL